MIASAKRKRMTKDKSQVLCPYRLDNSGDDDDKFWCYVQLTSAIAHRAPLGGALSFWQTILPP